MQEVLLPAHAHSGQLSIKKSPHDQRDCSKAEEKCYISYATRKGFSIDSILGNKQGGLPLAKKKSREEQLGTSINLKSLPNHAEKYGDSERRSNKIVPEKATSPVKLETLSMQIKLEMGEDDKHRSDDDSLKSSESSVNKLPNISQFFEPIDKMMPFTECFGGAKTMSPDNASPVAVTTLCDVKEEAALPEYTKYSSTPVPFLEDMPVLRNYGRIELKNRSTPSSQPPKITSLETAPITHARESNSHCHVRETAIVHPMERTMRKDESHVKENTPPLTTAPISPVSVNNNHEKVLRVITSKECSKMKIKEEPQSPKSVTPISESIEPRDSKYYGTRHERQDMQTVHSRQSNYMIYSTSTTRDSVINENPERENERKLLAIHSALQAISNENKHHWISAEKNEQSISRQVYPDYCIISGYPDKTITYPEKTIAYQDKTITYPDKSITYPDKSITYPEKLPKPDLIMSSQLHSPIRATISIPAKRGRKPKHQKLIEQQQMQVEQQQKVIQQHQYFLAQHQHLLHQQQQLLQQQQNFHCMSTGKDFLKETSVCTPHNVSVVASHAPDPPSPRQKQRKPDTSTNNKLESSTSPRKSKGGYLCDKCGKVYCRKYVLKIHQRVHSGEKPLACHICGKCFSDPSNMKKHVKLHETDHVTYPCKFCGRNFVRRRGLLNHMHSMHSRVPYQNENENVVTSCHSEIKETSP